MLCADSQWEVEQLTVAVLESGEERAVLRLQESVA